MEMRNDNDFIGSVFRIEQARADARLFPSSVPCREDRDTMTLFFFLGLASSRTPIFLSLFFFIPFDEGHRAFVASLRVSLNLHRGVPFSVWRWSNPC